MDPKITRAKSTASRMETAVYYGFNLRLALADLPDETLAMLESALDFVEGELERCRARSRDKEGGN